MHFSLCIFTVHCSMCTVYCVLFTGLCSAVHNELQQTVPQGSSDWKLRFHGQKVADGGGQYNQLAPPVDTVLLSTLRPWRKLLQ